jgi:formylglycine-generating enzyme required for sulfatase activity
MFTRASAAAACGLLLSASCAVLVGLEDDYHLAGASGAAGEEAAAAGAQTTDHGDTGGAMTAGMAGRDAAVAGMSGEGGNSAPVLSPSGAGGAGGAGGAEGGGGQGGTVDQPSVVCEPRCTGDKPVCAEGRCSAPRSCQGLTENCGATLNGPCCVQDQIEGDSFNRDYDDGLDMVHGATVSTFSLDRMEVTVARFRAFVQAGGGTKIAPPAIDSGENPGAPGSGWKATFSEALVSTKVALVEALSCDHDFQTWSDDGASSTTENRPINCVTWYEAFAFCIWDGGRLPTEAEWNFAAAGGNAQRVYPWSSPSSSTTITPAHASYYVDATKQCFGDGKNGCILADIVVAGSKSGAGAFGTRELAGNLAEWVLDYHADSYISPCIDCAQLDSATYRSVRGGAFGSDTDGIKVTSRDYQLPTKRGAERGFRCAY